MLNRVIQKKETKKWTDVVTGGFLTFMIVSLIIFATTSFLTYILIFSALIIFFLYLLKTNGKFTIKIDSFHLFMASFAAFCIFSSVWSYDSSSAIQKGTTMFELLICMSILYICYQGVNNIEPILNALKWGGYIVAIYTISYYGISGLSEILNKGDRLENDFANVNTIAMMIAVAMLISAFQIIYSKIKLSDIFLIPCSIVIMASGSRKALIMVVVGIIFLILNKYSTKSFFKTMIKYGCIFIVIIVVLYGISNLSIFAGIKGRMEGLLSFITGSGKVDSSTLKRADFAKIAISGFINHPLIGIGTDNAKYLIAQKYGIVVYSHNNFAEILCNGGIIGFVIYYSRYVFLVFNFLKNRKNDKYTVFCLILTLLLLIMEYAMVSYYSKIYFFYMMLLFLQVRILKNQQNCNSDKDNAKSHKIGARII